MDAAAELRPLSLGELLDRSFSLYRRHFWLFVGIMLIPSVFSIPFNFSFLSMYGGRMAMGGRPTAAPQAGVILGVLLWLVLFWVLYALAIGASTYAVSDVYLGRPATVRDSYGRIRTGFARIIGLVLNIALRLLGIAILGLIGLGIIVGLAAGGAAVLARGSGSGARVTVGIIVALAMVVAYLAFFVFFTNWAVRYAVSISALLLENLGVVAAVRRSVQLTKGRRWQIFIAVLVCTVVAYAGVVIFQGPLWVSMMLSAQHGSLAAWQIFLYSVLGSIGGALTMPLMMIVLVVCYYDSRIRKEAFDLQFLMSSLDPPVAPAGSVGSPV